MPALSCGAERGVESPLTPDWGSQQHYQMLVAGSGDEPGLEPGPEGLPRGLPIDSYSSHAGCALPALQQTTGRSSRGSRR